MKKITVSSQEANLLGNIYRRVFTEKDVSPEKIDIFLKIKSKKSKNRR